MGARWAKPKMAALVLLAAMLVAGAQTQGNAPAPADTAPASGGPVREIHDPQTGQRWVLLKDAEHPRWPARLVPVEGPRDAEGVMAAAVLPKPVIRGGDAIVVEENTPVLEAKYDAVALSAAERGKAMNARLKVNGKVVHVVALGPGRAALAVNSGGRR